MILVDTSVLIDFFSGRKNTASLLLSELEESETPFYIPNICCQEVLQGARDHKEWKNLFEILSTQNLVGPRNQWICHSSAARIFFDARKKGLTIRSTVDCFIAQMALEERATLLHNDSDFESIKRVRPLKTLPS